MRVALLLTFLLGWGVLVKSSPAPGPCATVVSGRVKLTGSGKDVIKLTGRQIDPSTAAITGIAVNGKCIYGVCK